MVYRSRCKPIGEFHFGARFKKQSELPAFRAYPKSVLTAIGVHVWINRFAKCLIIYPSKTFSFIAISSRSKHFALVFWRNDHFGYAITSFKKHHAVVLFQKFEIIPKRTRFKIVSLVVIFI